MSVKRQATTELNHDNWDQDDPPEHDEMGTYTMASKEVLEKRVIKTAKRRSQQNSRDEVKKGVFSGFGGFNKAAPSSFDFLANLTNGNKTNGSVSKNENTVTSSLLNSKPTGDGPPTTSLFKIPVSSTSVTKSTFGKLSSQSPSLFTSTPTSIASPSFGVSKADSTVSDSLINKPSSSIESPSKLPAKVSQVSSTIFGTPTTTTSSSLFSSTTLTSTSTPFKIQPVSSTTSTKSFTNDAVTTNNKVESDNLNNNNSKSESKKLVYYGKLKGLNESVSEWIKKHVEETPLCILTPIFRDYERHLKEIQNEYEGTGTEDKSKPNTEKPISQSIAKPIAESSKSPSSSLFSTTVNSKNLGNFANNVNTDKKLNSSFQITKDSSTNKSLLISEENKLNTSPTKTTSTSKFSFGVNTTTASSSATNSPGFSFGINKSNSSETNLSSPFASSNTSATPAAPFSFGLGKTFSFSQNTQKQETKEEENEDQDQPPKVEFTPIIEENSVYDKKCKIFVKNDGNFVDKGVGTLYIKKIEESGKHQLLVRANTNLGTVLLNLILAAAIPTQRMGKNNVMLVCIPTPDSKPPPTPILIRVKTAEEADELLSTLNKYKS